MSTHTEPLPEWATDGEAALLIVKPEADHGFAAYARVSWHHLWVRLGFSDAYTHEALVAELGGREVTVVATYNGQVVVANPERLWQR